MPNSNIRVTGLVGCDYSGSTVLSSVLDGLPTVASVGETHWIVDRDHGCRECRDQPCPVFTAELRDTLRALSPDDLSTHWWPLIAEATAAQVLVSSDKRPAHFERLGLPTKWIFLYKNPVAHVYSQARRLASRRGAAVPEDADIRSGITWYVKNSLERITFLESAQGPVGVLQNEALAGSPREVLAAVATFLDVPTEESALDYWKRSHHYIGGNFSVKNVTRSSTIDHHLRVDTTYMERLTNEQRALIAEHPGVKRVLARIDSALCRDNWVRLG